MNNQQAINLLKGLEQSLDDYCELNDEGKTAFGMAIMALELFGNSEQLPSAQPKSYREGYQAGFKDAQPERKRGKWIAVTEDGDVYKRICSCCGKEAFFQNDDPDELYDGGRYKLSDFCPHCGADMREVDE